MNVIKKVMDKYVRWCLIGLAKESKYANIETKVKACEEIHKWVTSAPGIQWRDRLRFAQLVGVDNWETNACDCAYAIWLIGNRKHGKAFTKHIEKELKKTNTNTNN